MGKLSYLLAFWQIVPKKVLVTYEKLGYLANRRTEKQKPIWRYKMSLRQDVFDYLKKHPRSSLDKTKSEFPDKKDTTIKRYYFEYKKLKETVTKPKTTVKTKAPAKKVSKKPASKKSIRQEVLDYLKKSPEASPSDLYKAFPKANQKTIRNYRLQWKKEQVDTQPDPDIETKIFNYLCKNPESNLNDLREEFTNTENLITIFRSWKKQNCSESPKPSKPDSEKEDSAEVEKQTEMIKKHKTIIEKQKEIIEKQKTRIDKLKYQVSSSINKGFTKTIKDFIVSKITKK